MPKTDRKALIRLASTLPVGSPERKAILTGLQKQAAPERRVTLSATVWIDTPDFSHEDSNQPQLEYALEGRGSPRVLKALRQRAEVEDEDESGNEIILEEGELFLVGEDGRRKEIKRFEIDFKHLRDIVETERRSIALDVVFVVSWREGA